MKAPVCLGDATTGGGEVVQCQLAQYRTNGVVVAVVGDLATCAVHPGRHAFVEGSAQVRMAGKSVVLDGHRLACGCKGIAGRAITLAFTP